MKLRDLIQELKRFNFEIETNVTGLKKTKDGLELKIEKLSKDQKEILNKIDNVKVKSKPDKSI